MENTWSALLDTRQIKVNRDERQRKELVGIDELAASILRRGQLQPIVVTRDNVLVAGERRFTAIQKINSDNLGKPALLVKVVYSDEIDPVELQALELEENIKRIDLPWKDNCLAIHRYHLMQLDRDPEWTISKTADALGLSKSEISERLGVASELLSGNKLVTEAPKLSTAKGIVARQNERKEAAQVSQLTALISPRAVADQTPSGTRAQPEGGPSLPPPSGTGYILNENFHDWAESYNGQKFNLIHCDFPYGVGMHKSDQGSGAAHGTYEDTPDIYWSLVSTLLNKLDNFCEESAHLLFWFSMDYYQDTLDQLSTRFRVNPFPLVWHKSDGAGILPDPNRGPRRTYETAFFASRGDRKIVRAVANSVASPIHRGRHMSEKPQDVLRHFFRMVVDEHSAVLDPTCGSGSAIRAAVATGAGRFLGLEVDKTFADHADELLAADLEELETPML
jgi:ParB/RepB/Spo0J family partition protein